MKALKDTKTGVVFTLKIKDPRKRFMSQGQCDYKSFSEYIALKLGRVSLKHGWVSEDVPKEILNRFDKISG